jgi:hypothetical protein
MAAPFRFIRDSKDKEGFLTPPTPFGMTSLGLRE